MDRRPIPGFHVVAKPIGPICNLDCSYCFYLEKDQLYPGVDNFRMSPDVLEAFIKQKIQGHSTSPVHFTWQGGEPTLLGVDYFQNVVHLQQKYAAGKNIENGFQTNGILIDDAWCHLFKENNFLIGLSLDGPQAIHDTYRLNKGQTGSFAQVLQALELLKKHEVEYNTITVVSAANQDYPDEIYNFLKSIGSAYWQFIPIVERVMQEDGSLADPDEMGNIPMGEWSVEPLAYGKFLERIFQRWIREDVGEVFIQHFESALANQMGLSPAVCVWNATCGRALAIEHNGDVYSCDHYVFPKYRLGNIMELPLVEMVQDPVQIQFGDAKRDRLPQICLDCKVLDLCHGECPKHRFIKSAGDTAEHNYLCAGYKHFFTTIRPDLGVLAELLDLGKPAENVKQWMLEKDAGFPGIDVTPHDPCPCGSGTKFEDCCTH